MTEHGTSPAGGVAIIVTHYKSLPALRASLESVRDFADAVTTEVVVTDSEVQPGTEEAVRELLPRATFLGFAEDVGYAVSVGAGLAVTTAPWVLVLNADVRLRPGTVEGLVGALVDDPSLALVGPVLRYDDGALQDSAFRFYRPSTVLHRRTGLGRSPWGRAALARFTAPSREVAAELADPSRGPVETDWLLGAAMMVRRTALEEVGAPDTRYWMYFEDVDWCLRFWQAGWRVAVVPAALALHTYGRASRGKGPLAVLRNAMARQHVRSAVTFFRAHGVRPDRVARGRAAAPAAAAAAAVGR